MPENQTTHWRIDLTDEEHIMLGRLMSTFSDSPSATALHQKVMNAELVWK